MRLLTTTDSSAHSLRVLPHAAKFAAGLGGELVLLRVFDPRVDAASEPGVTLAEATASAMQRWRKELLALLEREGIAGDAIVGQKGRGEEMHAALLRIAGESGAGMMAMDSRGAGALRHALLGSVAMGIIGNSKLPVLVTGQKAEAPAPGGALRLVVTNDGSAAALDVVNELAPLLEGREVEVTLLRVYEGAIGDAGRQAEAESAAAELEAVARRFPKGPAVRVAVEAAKGLEKVDAAIVRVAVECGASAIAMSTHGHSARRHLLAGSVALGVLAKSPVPLILARGG